METSILAVILAANVMDLVPNSSNTPLTWLLAGTLWGRLELERRTREETAVTPPGPAGYRRRDPPEAVEDPQPVTSSAATPLNAYTRQTKRINRKEATAR